MTGNELSALAGLLLSLGFSYIPKLNDWYAPKDQTTKSLIMLGLLALAALGVYGSSCLNLWVIVQCSEAGAKGLVEAFIAALVVNQAAYKISPQRKVTIK